MERSLRCAILFSKLVLVNGQAGTPDTDFSADGLVETSFGNFSSRANAVAVQPDGRILLAGQVDDGIGGVNGALTRYLANGTIDLSFALNGYAVTPFGFLKGWQYMALEPDGSMLVAGAQVNAREYALGRFDSDGILDPAFGTGGLVNIGFMARGMALQTDGSILVCGNSGDQFILERFLPDGSVDTGFATGGSIVDNTGGDVAAANSVLLQPDGKILLFVSYTLAGERDALVCRFDTDGTPDNTFGSMGHVTIECGSTSDNGTSGALQPDGAIVCTSEDGNYGYVILRMVSLWLRTIGRIARSALC